MAFFLTKRRFQLKIVIGGSRIAGAENVGRGLENQIVWYVDLENQIIWYEGVSKSNVFLWGPKKSTNSPTPRFNGIALTILCSIERNWCDMFLH